MQCYRRYSFNINDKVITAIGLGHPMENEESLAVLRHLSFVDDVHLLVGLESKDSNFICQNFLEIDEANKYELIKIDDYMAPTQEQFDKFFNCISKVHKFAVYCRAGIGRTGTMLAALALLELVSNNNRYIAHSRNSNIVYTKDGECLVTTLVRMAIDKIRAPVVAIDSVETISQAKSLLILEKRCRNILDVCFNA